MTGRQKKALAALLSYPTMNAAASAAGVNYSTLRRWMTDDTEFREAYHDELSALVEDAANNVRKSMGEILDNLYEIATCGTGSNSVAVAAAKVFLDSGIRIIEAASYETRIAELERSIAEAREYESD